MAEKISYKHGEFCWFELATSDQNSAKKFYSQLFDWQTQDQPIGPDAIYTTLQKDGKSVGALFGMSSQELAAGIPPHWQTYIAVESADASAEKAKELGGSIIEGPFDVMDVGRMAVVKDPTGAIFSVWEAKRHQGASLVSETNSFCWFELNTRDMSSAQDFYTNLMGWSPSGSPAYVEWKIDGQTSGGMMQIQEGQQQIPPHWLNYVMVAGLDEKTTKAESLGGQILMPPTPVPGMGRFSVVKDPQGAVFAMFEVD